MSKSKSETPELETTDSDTTEPKTSSKSRLTKTERERKRQKYFQTTILYSDYDFQQMRKIVSMARKVVETAFGNEHKSENEFFMIVSNQIREVMINSEFSQTPETKKWCCIAGNDFAMNGEAVIDTIAFFTVGDLKILLYRPPEKKETASR